MDLTTAAPGITEIPSSTPFPTDTPSITPTSTSSIPMATVSVNTNCRIGPSVVYDLVAHCWLGSKLSFSIRQSPNEIVMILDRDYSEAEWAQRKPISIAVSSGFIRRFHKTKKINLIETLRWVRNNRNIYLVNTKRIGLIQFPPFLKASPGLAQQGFQIHR